ncbi:FAD-dependent monooxygenase [Streptomyces mobaraensis]|uniref:FAD-dependent monooxygenase n=2 Tax=Streptomyces TaxID=1883 RepID=UPI0031016B99
MRESEAMEQSVVIVGGGPTGSWLACELRVAGVPTVVLERDPGIDPRSRALTVHPRTIETLALRDAHRDLLAEGGRIPSGHFAVLDERLDFRGLDTDFPFTLTIPQARTTELLRRRALGLGADLRRGHRVTDCAETGDGVAVSVEGPDGAAGGRRRSRIVSGTPYRCGHGNGQGDGRGNGHRIRTG